jgi:hypothetical protein
MSMSYPDHSICTLTIGDFLLRNKLPWEKNPDILLVEFRVVGEQGTYKIVSIGRNHTTMVSILSDAIPGKYVISDDVGGLMGELMDMSILFSLYKATACQKDFTLEYVVWLKRLEPGQESNLDADMVERFSRKICEDD